jgi:hypothetical protein
MECLFHALVTLSFLIGVDLSPSLNFVKSSNQSYSSFSLQY